MGIPAMPPGDRYLAQQSANAHVSKWSRLLQVTCRPNARGTTERSPSFRSASGRNAEDPQEAWLDSSRIPSGEPLYAAPLS
jgi:hypothetical protein